MRKCIICGKEVTYDGGTEMDGIRYPIHFECYKNSNDKILREKIKENHNAKTHFN